MTAARPVDALGFKLPQLALLGSGQPAQRETSFEVFGFDFFIDEAYKPWLIEINSSPAVDYSTPVTEACKLCECRGLRFRLFLAAVSAILLRRLLGWAGGLGQGWSGVDAVVASFACAAGACRRRRRKRI